jgi:GntR family transcriptional regulator
MLSAPFDPARMTVRELDNLRVPAEEYLSERLGGTKGMLLDVVEVLVLFDGEPMSRRASYVRAGDEPVERLYDAVPLTLAFEKVFGIEFGNAEYSIEAVPAGANISRLLEIEPGAPVLIQERLLRDRLGVPQELSYTHYRADRVSLTVRDG